METPYRVSQYSVESDDPSQPEAVSHRTGCPPETSLECLLKQPAELFHTRQVTLSWCGWPEGKDPVHVPWIQRLLLGTEVAVSLLPLCSHHPVAICIPSFLNFVPLFGWSVRCCTALPFTLLHSPRSKDKYYALQLPGFSLLKQAKKYSEYRTLYYTLACSQSLKNHNSFLLQHYVSPLSSCFIEMISYFATYFFFFLKKKKDLF